MLTKIVNGKTVEMSADEEAELRAEWAENTPSFADEREEYFRVNVRPTRELILNRLMDIAFAEKEAARQDNVDLILAARTSLLGITTATAVMAATDMPGLKKAVLQYYRDAESALPGEIKNAFNEVDV